MRYDVDDKGHIRGLYTQILEQGENGMVMKEPERFWPADLVLLSIGFEGTEPTVPNAFRHLKRIEMRIVADDIQTIKLIMKRYLLPNVQHNKNFIWQIKR